MGMSIGKQTGAMAEMNIVPLIDILLVLLIIFMVITPLTPRGMEVLVPQLSQNVEPAPPVSAAIVVQVLADSETKQAALKINNENVTWQAFGPRMDRIFKERAEKVAFVKGGNDVMFMDVARAVDIMRGAGIDKVGLITAKLEAAQ
jgi:biopolymer transport protein TolR